MCECPNPSTEDPPAPIPERIFVPRDPPPLLEGETRSEGRVQFGLPFQPATIWETLRRRAPFATTSPTEPQAPVSFASRWRDSFVATLAGDGLIANLFWSLPVSVRRNIFKISADREETRHYALLATFVGILSVGAALTYLRGFFRKKEPDKALREESSHSTTFDGAREAESLGSVTISSSSRKQPMYLTPGRQEWLTRDITTIPPTKTGVTLQALYAKARSLMVNYRVDFRASDGESRLRGGAAIVVRGGVLIPRHSFADVDPSAPFSVSFTSYRAGKQAGGEFANTWQYSDFSFVKIHPRLDICFIPRAGVTVPNKLDISGLLFRTPYEATQLDGAHLIMPMGTSPESEIEIHSLQAVWDPSQNMYSYARSHIPLEDWRGACMSPLVAMHKGGFVVVGFHSRGTATGETGYSFPFTLQDLNLLYDERSFRDPTDIRFIPTVPEDCDNPVLYDAKQMIELHSRTELGHLTPSARAFVEGSQRARIRPGGFTTTSSPFHRLHYPRYKLLLERHGAAEYVVPPVGPRVSPEGEYFSPGKSFFSTLGVSGAYFNTASLQAVAGFLGKRLSTILHPRAGVIPLADLFFADSTGFLNKVNLTTSLGPPFAGPKVDLISLDHDARTVTLPLSVSLGVSSAGDAWASGAVTYPSMSISLKDEPVKVEKAATRAIRTICVLPCHFNLAMRQLFQPFFAGFAANPRWGIPFLDRSGWEWEYFFRTHFVHEWFLCGDFSKMDRRFHATILAVMAASFATAFTIHPFLGGSAVALSCAVLSVGFVYACYNGDYFWMGDVNSSGNALTLVLNCLFQLVLLLYAYYSKFGTFDGFEENVRFAFIGDDSIINLSTHIKELGFTPEYIQAGFALCGAIWTDPSDKGIAPVAFRRGEGEISFCSRIRIQPKDRSYHVWALSKERLLRMLSFRKRTSESLADRERDLSLTALEEAAYWGEDFFNDVVEIVSFNLQSLGVRMSGISLEYLHWYDVITAKYAIPEDPESYITPVVLT